MNKKHLTSEERYTIARLRARKWPICLIAETLGRHRSTIYRELNRNCSKLDGKYRWEKAHYMGLARRRKAGKNKRLFTNEWARVCYFLRREWSPEQISGRLLLNKEIRISHETIYRYIRDDKMNGGYLHRYLRLGRKIKRKHYGTIENRGKVRGKTMIDERPHGVDSRWYFGHWEVDTVLGKGSKHCLLTLVERKTGYTIIEKLDNRTVQMTNKALLKIIKKYGLNVKTITADNGTEFHGFKALESETHVKVYFAHPYHSWERGTNENTNGLIRWYIPKGKNMENITQKEIAGYSRRLNNRPRKRLSYMTPQEAFEKYCA